MRRLLYLIQFIYSCGFNLLYRTLPTYLATYVSSAFQISLVQTAHSVVRLFNIPCGAVADRVGKRKTLFLVFFFLPFVALTFTISRSVWHFTLMFMVIGLLANFYYSSTNALVTIFFQKRVESLFKLEAMYQLGLMAGPVIGGFLTLQYGIEAAFYTWAGLGVVGLVLSSLFLRKSEQPVQEKKLGSVWDGIKGNKPAFLLFLSVGGFITGLMEAFHILGIPLYGSSLGMTIYEVGLIFGISSVISFFGFFLLGKQLDKIRKEASLVIGLVLMAVPFLLFALFQDILMLAVLSGIFTLGRAGGLNIARAFVSDSVDQRYRASGIATVDTSLFLGRIAGPLIGGLIIDFINIPFMFMTAGAVSLAGILVVAVYWALRKQF